MPVSIGELDLNAVRAFIGVHETGSFSAAGERLRVPRSTISRAVAALEDALGVELFHRTTRNVTTTVAGLALFERLAPTLAALESALADVPYALDTPAGTLRILTTADLGVTLIADAVATFTTRYPATRVEVHLGSVTPDLSKGRFDLALRFGVAPLRDSSLVVRKLGAVRIGLYASPIYLARRGTPTRLSDVNAHDFVGYPNVEAPPGLTVTPRIVGNDKFFIREAMRSGAGIGFLPSYLVADDLEVGSLVRVLPQWEHESAALSLVQPSRKHVPRSVSVFRDLLIERFRQRPFDR